jgi:hypothetical protein
MSVYLLPTTIELVDDIAKSLARSEMLRDAMRLVNETIGADVSKKIAFEDSIDRTMDAVINQLWASNMPGDEGQREIYRSLANAAIRTMNLKLVQATER